MLAPAAFPALFFTLAGFVLLLLVTLSVPLIKTIYLLSITGPGGVGVVRLGAFGACYEGGSAEILGFTSSSFSRCSPVTLGYDLDARWFGNTNSGSGRFLVKALVGALVLNPIAAGLAGISLILAFVAWCASSRIMEIITFVTLIIAKLAAWIAFALDLAIALVANKRVDDYTNRTFDAKLGNAVWIALAGAIIMSLATCAAGCGAFGRYSARNRTTTTSPGMVVNEKPRRTWPWTRKSTYRGTY